MSRFFPEIIRIPLPTPFPVGSVNAFLVKDDPPILVDAGMKTEEGYQRLVSALGKHGLNVGDLGLVFLTHAHLDHIGLVSRILDESRAEVYAHPHAVKVCGMYEQEMRDTQRFLDETMRRFGVPDKMVDKILAEREGLEAFAPQAVLQHVIEDGESVAGFTAYHVPGHSASDTVFYHPEWRIAFTGDHVLPNVTPNPLLRRKGPGQPRAKSLVEYERSLQRTRSLDIETCYPGHGPSFGDHRKVIDHLLTRHERRTSVVRSALEQGRLTPYQVAMILFPRISYKVLHLGLSVAIGHLDVLDDQGIAAQEEENGVVRYGLVRP